MTKSEAIKKVRHYNKVIDMVRSAKTDSDLANALVQADFDPWEGEDLADQIENYCEDCVNDIDNMFPGIVEESLAD